MITFKKYGTNSRLSFIDTDSLMYEIKIKDVYQYLSQAKGMFDLSNYSAKSKYYEDSNKLVVDKNKYQTAGVGFKEFVELKLKVYLVLVDDSGEHNKMEGYE